MQDAPDVRRRRHHRRSYCRVAEGGRTGLTSFTAAVLFLLALFLFPLFVTARLPLLR